MKIEKIKYNKRIKIYYKGEKPDQDIIDKSLLYLSDTKKNDLDLIKEGNSRKIYRSNIGNESYYFKKYSYRSLDKKLKNLIRKSAALRALKTSYLLLEKNIPVVKPVLALTYKHDFLTYDSLFVTEDFGGNTVRDLFIENYNNRFFIINTLKKLVEVFLDLYENNILHKDPNLVNFLFNNNKIVLVDVDDIVKFPFLTKKIIIKNLVRFNSHMYSNMKKDSFEEIHHINYEERSLFFELIFKKLGFQLNNYMEYINYKTMKKLSNYNNDEIIKSNWELNRYYKEE